MRTKILAFGFATALIAAPAFAMPQNHTVRLVVPVDISKMPYVNALTVDCYFKYAEDAVLPPGSSGHNRADIDFTGGEFHQNVDVVMTAPNGPKPEGYYCRLYVSPTDGGQNFEPIDPAKADKSDPPQHIAAQGTVPVTEISGTFEPLQFQQPQQMFQPRPLRVIKPPPGH